MGRLGTVKTDLHVLVAMDAKPGFNGSNPLAMVFAMAIVALVRAERFSLLGKPGLHEPRCGVPVVGSVVTADARFVVYGCKAHRHHLMIVKPHERLGVVSHLLSKCAGRLGMARVAFEVFM